MEKSYELNRFAKENLKEDEKIEWVGRPEPFSFISKFTRTNFIIRIAVAAVCAIVAIILYIILSDTANALVIAAIIIIAAIAGLYPIYDKRNMQNKTLYIITNQRVIRVLSSSEFDAIPRSSVKISTTDAGNDCIHAMFGSFANCSENRVFHNAATPKFDEKDNVIGLVFYNVKKTPELTSLLV